MKKQIKRDKQNVESAEKLPETFRNLLKKKDEEISELKFTNQTLSKKTA
jgi:hypothetical protein